MAFGVDDAVAGGFQLANGLINNYFAGQRQDSQNEFNSQMASDQYQRAMWARSTAYQTAVADMKSAGLNPMLAAGVNTSTPSISAASGSAPSTPDVGLGAAASTAMQHEKMKSELELMEYQKDVAAKTTRKLVAEGDRLDAETLKTAAETPGSKAWSDTLKKRLEEEENKRLQSLNERPYLNSTLAHVLQPTGKAASDVYRLIPPVRVNWNSAKGGQSGWVGGNEVDTSSFNSRWNASFGR